MAEPPHNLAERITAARSAPPDGEWTTRPTPDAIADAMVAEIKQPTKFNPIESDGSIRAARMLAEIL